MKKKKNNVGGKKSLLLVFIVVLLLKLVAIWFFVDAPSAFSDEYSYIKMARSFYYDQEFTIHGIEMHRYPPLYPIVMSIAYIFGDMEHVYMLMKIINAILGALVVIPIFLLSKEFFKKEIAIRIAFLGGILPGIFLMTPFILSENLFYPLFMFAFYFTYKSLYRYEWMYGFLAGLFIGLAMITRLIMLPFIGAILLMWLIERKKRFYEYINIGFRIGLGFIVVIIPYLLLYYDFGDTYGLGNYIFPDCLIALLAIPLVYIGYLMLAVGTPIFSFFPSEKLKGRKMYIFKFSLAIVFCFLVFLALRQMYDNGVENPIFFMIHDRPIGRYISFLIPPLIIVGFMNFKNKSKIKFPRKSILWIIALFFSIFLFYFTMLPPNNPDIIFLGAALKFISMKLGSLSWLYLPFVISTILLYEFIMLLLTEITLKEVLFYLIIISIICSYGGMIIISVNAYNWEKGEAMQFGKWVNNNIPHNTNIIIDKRDCDGRIEKANQTVLCEDIGRVFPTIMGVWINNNLYVEDPEHPTHKSQHIITRHEMPNMKLLHKTINGFKIYENVYKV